MTRILVPVVAMVMSGCALYGDDSGGDDDVAVDGGAPSMGGTWRVTWECAGTCGENPLGTTTQAVVSIDAAAPGVAIDWVANGLPAPASTHDGAIAPDGLCVDVQGGADGDWQHAAYRLCYEGPLWLAGTVEWGTGRWNVRLERL